MKADPYSIKRRPRSEKAFTFKDGDFEATLELRKFGVMGSTAIEEKARAMYRKYVSGSGPLKDDGEVDESSKLYVAPDALPFVDGEPVFLTWGTCQVVASVFLAQTEGDDALRYSFVELAMMCVSDSIAVQMMEAAAWVSPDDPDARDDDSGNLPGGATPPSLNIASSGSSSTPESSSGTLNSSGASTNGSEEGQGETFPDRTLTG